MSDLHQMSQYVQLFQKRLVDKKTLVGLGRSSRKVTWQYANASPPKPRPYKL